MFLDYVYPKYENEIDSSIIFISAQADVPL